MHQQYLPAMVERCQNIFEHLEWATAQLWQFDQPRQRMSVPFWMIHHLLRENIAPAFSRLRSPLSLNPAIANKLLDQIIANVAGIEQMFSLMRPQHASYS